jgi:hypothetical protein
MLSKVNKDNWETHGTPNIINFALNNKFNLIQDNLENYLLVKSNSQTYLYDYMTNKKINKSTIRLNILDKYFWKSIESFDQNNIKIANQIRKYIGSQFKDNEIFLGIGGEYYIYFSFIKSNQYIGISNHNSIILDADFNLQFYIRNYSNYLVDYNNLKTFPKLNINSKYNVIINVSNLHFNHIEYIKNINVEKLVIVTCTPAHKKINLIKKYFSIIKIKHFLNFTSWITILVCKKKMEKNEYVSLGSNCSITYQLNKLNLRTNSYPFDWAKITLGQLINVLTNNFDSYTNLLVEKLSLVHLTENLEPSLMIKNFYGIKFAHELNVNLETKILEFKSKLEKRIERFNNLSEIDKKIKFIRIELNKISLKYFDSINILIFQLEKFVKDFKLILVLNFNIDMFDIQLNPKVIIYRFEEFDSDWRMDKLDWKSIFYI